MLGKIAKAKPFAANKSALLAAMNERELRGRIEKVKSRVATQKRQIKRWKGDPATASAEQFLIHLEAKLRYLEAGLAKLRETAFWAVTVLGC